MLSIIIPVYNKEKYIEQCVGSILGQTYQDIQLILVDDGSIDNSGQLCDVIASKDGRIETVHINNQGSISARAIGVSHSKGEYVTFVDADDWIDENMYFDLMQLLRENDADFVSSGMIFEGVNSDTVYDGIKEGCYDVSKHSNILESIMWDFKAGKCGIMPSLCNKIFTRSFIESSINSTDKRITIGDDRAVFYTAAVKAKKFIVSHMAYYHYRDIHDSLSHDNDLSCFSKIEYMHEYMKKAFEESGVYSIVKDSFERNLKETLDIAERNVFGLSNENYVFPFSEVPQNSRLIIYGFGVVGKSYCKYLLLTKYAQIVAIADKVLDGTSFNGIPIVGMDEISAYEYDCVLIANLRENIADGIKADLLKQGINENNIKWVKPLLY